MLVCGCAETKGHLTMPNGAQMEASFTRMFWQTGDGELEFDPVTGKVRVGIHQSMPNAESLKIALDGVANIGKLILLAQELQKGTNSPPSTATNKTLLIDWVTK